MSWMVRGKLVFEFSDVIGFAVVSGIFVDNLNDPPAVHLVVPTDGAEFTAPQSVLLKAAVSGERQPVKVEFFSGSQLLGKASNEPYNLRWYGPVVGVHEITASLSDDRGLVAEAESVQVKILDDRPGAALLFGEDRTTKGNWREVYGEEGWAIAGIGTNLPPWASLRLENPSAKIHERFPTSGSARALVHPSTNERIASAWSSPNDWSLVLELNDTWWRKVALCFLDWERTGVDQSVTVSDLKTGEILATKRLSNFSDPTYLQFHVRGSVKMTFHAFVGKPVLSALFLDRLDQYQNWRHERFGSLLSTEPGMTNDGADPDGDGLVNLVEYRRGSDPLTKNTVQEDEYFVEDGFFHLVRKRTPGTDTLVQAIEYSHDLAHWTPIAPASREVHPAQDYEEIKSRFRLPSISSNFFLRVLVAPPGEHH